MFDKIKKFKFCNIWIVYSVAVERSKPRKFDIISKLLRSENDFIFLALAHAYIWFKTDANEDINFTSCGESFLISIRYCLNRYMCLLKYIVF